MFRNEVLGSVYLALLQGTHRQFIRQYSPHIAAKVILRFVEMATLPLFRRSWERVLLVEMHFADADGLLQGKTEAERFEYFIREVVKPEHFTSLLKKYPVLWQRWQDQFASCLESIETLLSRLVADKEGVAAQLYDDRIVRKISRLTPVGDPHAGMQQTTRIDYLNERDEPRVVYYKPRPIGIDAGLTAFFQWWNQHFHLDHQTPLVVERAGYGWTKAIPHQACETKDQVCAYYRRYGSLVALGHLFRTTDLHRENLVACGEYPVIVDCETMFSSTLAAHSAFPGESHLYASCLLPVQRLWDSVEISPLSARSGQETDIEVWVNPQRRSSAAKLEMHKLKTPDCACEVFLGRTRVDDFIDYADSIIEGMRRTLEFAAENKDAILSRIDECMRGVAVRILFRATATYVSALTNSWHPDSLHRGETELDLHKFVDGSRDPKILQSELSQLRKGDIPYFSTYFDRPEVVDGNGQRLALPIVRTPQQKIRHQFSRLNQRFITESVEDLEYALLTYRLRRGDRNPGEGSRLRELDHLPDAAWFNAAATAVLDKVLEKALLLEDDCYFWRSMGSTEPARLQAGLTNSSLYDGVAGIALAYFTAGKRLRSDRYLNFARRLAGQIARQLADNRSAEPGALTGTMGTLWAISFIFRADCTPLLSTLEQELPKLCHLFLTQKWSSYKQLDYVSGAAGSLSMLVRLHSLFQNYPIASEMRQLASFLFETLKSEAATLRQEDTLLGFAHGTAGVSAALAEYMTYFAIRDGDAVALIGDNVGRENAFRTVHGWPHLGNARITNTSWCHGTVGFGFSRLHLKPYISAAIYEEDMAIVIKRLGETQASLGLCHGMMADYYLERALGGDGVHALRCVRHQLAQDGLTTSFGLNNFENVGAMTGVTGLFAGEALYLCSADQAAMVLTTEAHQ